MKRSFGTLARALIAVVVGAPLGCPQLSAQRVSGTVVDQLTTRPVSGVDVTLVDGAGRGVVVARTTRDGGFSLAAPEPGMYRVRFQVPGYRMLVSSPLDLRLAQDHHYSLELTPVPAEQLDTLLVEGKPVPRLLAGFYRRRANSFGNFVTHDEFMRFGPVETSDVVRRMRLLDVLPDANSARGYRIVGAYERRLRRPCPPAVFRDGVFLGTSDEIDIDLIFVPDAIEAVEAYGGDAGLPAEFMMRGKGCGVLALWSRNAIEGQRTLHMDVMGHFGARVGGMGGASVGRFGLGFAVNFAGTFEFSPVVNLVVPIVGDSPQPSGFQAIMAVRMRPLGLSSPWYVGLGGTGLYLSEGTGSILGPGVQRDEAHAFLLTGLALPLRSAERPFLELQLYDPLTPRAAQVHAFLGLLVRLY